VDAHRGDIAKAVAVIEALDVLEAEHRRAVLEWIESGDELYRLVPPDQPSKHLVSYFVPFDPASGSVLLTAHRKSGLVLPPGGHCEAGELPWQTVERECVEELGIPAAALPWLGTAPLFVTVTETQGSVVRRHTDVSLWHVITVEREDRRLRPDAGEFDGVRWLTFDEVLAEPIERLDPHMHRFARKLRAAGGDAAADRRCHGLAGT
jgi:8-oxo-dGTP pyrophosphatase MutT (NUDIX family)